MYKKTIEIKSALFFILHEEIVKKADLILKPLGGLDRRTNQHFYGFGEGEDSRRSINHVVSEFLHDQNFSFPGFFRSTKDSSVKFNPDYLRKMKTVYNKRFKEDNFNLSSMKIGNQYLIAFLFFLGYNDLKMFITAHHKYEDAKIIEHTFTSKKEKNGGNQFRFFNENRNIPEGYENAIKNKVEHTEWYLYTYNYDHKKIVKASLEIKEIGDKNNYVNLANSGGGYNYIGYANFRLAPHRIVSFDLVSRIVPAKHFHLKFYMNFGRTEESIMLGKQIGFGHSFKLITSNAILIRVDQEEESSLGIGFYEHDHPELHPAVKKFLHPMNVQYSIIQWRTFFTWDGLYQWLNNPTKDQPKHFEVALFKDNTS